MGHLQAGLIQIVNRCGVRYGRLRVPCTVGAYLCRGVEGRRVLEHGRKPDWPGVRLGIPYTERSYLPFYGTALLVSQP